MIRSDFGPVDFSSAAIESSSGASGVAPGHGVGPSGDIQFIGPVIIPEPTLTTWDRELTEMVQFRGTPLPLAEQMRAGLDPEKMNALIEDCNNGKLSVNDLAAELMILTLNNAMENKSIERQMRAELAQVQFQNGMKVADLIKQRGELTYKKAVTEAVTKMTTLAVDLGSKATAHYIANQKKSGMAEVNVMKGSKDTGKDFKYSPNEQKAIIERGEMVSDALKKIVESTSTLISGELELGISKIDAQQKATEAMNKLLDSIASSVESSIRTQDQAIQFAMGMIDKINSLAHDSFSRIVGNIRA
ncbi:MAG: hypothetical protein LBQ03_01135 [Puniceicoccales bacterium]|jgi:hypothetical protein|nr:hypothetical protein [Puniceicoccales bacterium]